MRDDVERLHPTGQFAEFFDAYDNPAITGTDFDLRRDAVVHYLRTVANQAAYTLGSDNYIPATGAADSAQAMSVMLGRSTFAADYPPHSPYIEMDLFEAENAQRPGDSDNDAMLRAAQMHFEAGKRVFGHANLIDYPTMMRIAANAHATVTGFSYYANGHFIAYVRKDDQWWMIDDHVTRKATEIEIRAVPYALDLHMFTTTGKGSGISTFALE
ncbi:hypothetical protein [Robbsia sp. KACC 23696]|uniref:hypothetical protein n=1 Tax=Robbsia sp. KACC 23696 TaxID=3149231 RepID=UPI00325C2513